MSKRTGRTLYLGSSLKLHPATVEAAFSMAPRSITVRQAKQINILDDGGGDQNAIDWLRSVVYPGSPAEPFTSVLMNDIEKEPYNEDKDHWAWQVDMVRHAFPCCLNGFYMPIGFHGNGRDFGSILSRQQLNDPNINCVLPSVYDAYNEKQRADGGCLPYADFVESVLSTYRSQHDDRVEVIPVISRRVQGNENEPLMDAQTFYDNCRAVFARPWVRSAYWFSMDVNSGDGAEYGNSNALAIETIFIIWAAMLGKSLEDAKGLARGMA